MARITILITLFVVAFIIGCQSSDNSGGTTTTCGYACVQGSESAERSNVKSGLRASSDNESCEAQASNAKTETGYSICSQEVLTTSEDLPCDLPGAPFVIVVNQQIDECFRVSSNTQAQVDCVGTALADYETPDFDKLPPGCASCGQTALSDFFSCIEDVQTLNDDTLTPCIATWVTSSTSCNP